MEEVPAALSPSDVESLRLLSLFYRIATWLFGLGMCLGIPHATIGLLSMTGQMEAASRKEEIPQFFGAFFLAAGLGVMLLMVALAVCCRFASRWITERSHYGLLFAFGCVLCMTGVPGVALGVYTLVVLSRAQVKSAFALEGR